MKKDSVELIKRCRPCQEYANIPHRPPKNSPQCPHHGLSHNGGVDIMGPLPRGKGGVKFTIVAVDYFTKWVEAKALVSITEKAIKKFLWCSVVCRFWVPRVIVTNNGKQFDYEAFRKWCSEWKIKSHYFSPAHPQANEQVKATNKSIFKMIEKKLDAHKGSWLEELLGVLWAYCTTTKTPTG